MANIDSESIWEQVQTRNRPLLRYLESELSDLSKKLKERKIIDPPHQSNKSTLFPVPEGSFSSESEEEDIEVASSNSEGEEEDSEDEESANEEDDMENFLDEIDLAEERRLTELENPSSLEQVHSPSPISPPDNHPAE